MDDSRTYDDFPGACQRCGGVDCVKNAHQGALFAKLISPQGSFVDVNVALQRHVCRGCGGTYTSRGPFHEGTIYGAPIVDVALAFSMDQSAHSVERTLANFGVHLSTDAVLDCVRLFARRAKGLAPLVEGQGDGLYAIDMLKLLFGVEDAGQLKEKLPQVSLESLTDETFPRRKGAVKKIMDEIMDGKKRVVHRGAKGDMIVDGKDRKASFPESFTLALSYLPGAEAYASLICTPQSFNQLLADILFKALEGASFNMTDGSHSYNGVKNHALDPVHRTRTELRRDPKFRELKKGARRIWDEGRRVEGRRGGEDAGHPAQEGEGRGGLSVCQGEVPGGQEVDDRAGQEGAPRALRWQQELHGQGDYQQRGGGREPPGQGRGQGPLLEGRLRAAGKSVLATIRDSISIIGAGRAAQSMANAVGAFTFGRVMLAA